MNKREVVNEKRYFGKTYDETYEGLETEELRIEHRERQEKLRAELIAEKKSAHDEKKRAEEFKKEQDEIKKKILADGMLEENEKLVLGDDGVWKIEEVDPSSVARPRSESIGKRPNVNPQDGETQTDGDTDMQKPDEVLKPERSVSRSASIQKDDESSAACHVQSPSASKREPISAEREFAMKNLSKHKFDILVDEEWPVYRIVPDSKSFGASWKQVHPNGPHTCMGDALDVSKYCCFRSLAF